jgi:hypothetical protein
LSESRARSLSYGDGTDKVKKYAFTILLAIVVFVAPQLFILDSADAESDCTMVCEGSFVIDEIDTRADLQALSGCTTVTGDLSIEYSSLTSLEGLECLAHVDGRLDIKLNESLTSLVGLESVEYVGGKLVIWYNRALCTSMAEALKDRLLKSDGTGRSINISMNKPGC